MAISPHDKQRSDDEEDKEPKPRAQSSKCVADSPKEQAGVENEGGDSRANKEEMSSKSSNMLDLNLPCEEKEESMDTDDQILLPSEGSNNVNGCMMNSDNQTPPATSSKLMLKGCIACYLFVMIPENNNQRCPKCGQGTYLINV